MPYEYGAVPVGPPRVVEFDNGNGVELVRPPDPLDWLGCDGEVPVGPPEDTVPLLVANGAGVVLEPDCDVKPPDVESTTLEEPSPVVTGGQ